MSSQLKVKYDYGSSFWVDTLFMNNEKEMEQKQLVRVDLLIDSIWTSSRYLLYLPRHVHLKDMMLIIL